MLALTVVAVGLAVAACALPTDAPNAASRATGQSACNAAAAQGAVGQMPSAALLESARVQARARTARLIAHNELITKEFNAQRLNLLLDANGRVERVSCG